MNFSIACPIGGIRKTAEPPTDRGGAMLRDVLGAIAGFAIWTALWLSYNAMLRKRSLLPADENDPVDSTGVLLMVLFGSVLYSIIAGYVATWVASSSEYVSAVMLAAALVLVGILVQSRIWRTMPIWYHLSFLVLLAPAALAGAWLRLS